MPPRLPTVGSRRLPAHRRIWPTTHRFGHRGLSPDRQPLPPPPPHHQPLDPATAASPPTVGHFLLRHPTANHGSGHRDFSLDRRPLLPALQHRQPPDPATTTSPPIVGRFLLCHCTANRQILP
uniref:Uncharacterized protein n=1 Tax=Oryza nivara TaxID=4536 RepID=A0A0E0IHJ2_ORYNI